MLDANEKQTLDFILELGRKHAELDTGTNELLRALSTTVAGIKTQLDRIEGELKHNRGLGA